MVSDFIPNSFQTPNAYADKFMAFLTPEEWKVLSYFVRRIFGFQKRQDNIAISQIANGIVTKDGTRLDYGTGLGEAAIRKAIDSLKEFNLIIEIAPNDPHQNKGPLFVLQLDSSLVNETKIMDRYYKTKEKQNQRMEKARKSRTATPPVIEHTPSYPIEPPPSYPIEGGVVLSNKTHNNQGNTVIKTDSPAGAGTPPKKKNAMPADILRPMVDAIADVTGEDKSLNYGKLAKAAKTLVLGKYTPEQVLSIYAKPQPNQKKGAWWTIDWRGRKGERPNIATINATIKVLSKPQPGDEPNFAEVY